MVGDKIGRGISNFFGSDDDFELLAQKLDIETEQTMVSIEYLYPNPDQPRRYFSPEGIEELSQSILRNGILQPILVRPHPLKDNAYEIIAGERRWQASQKAGQNQVPVIIKSLSDADVIEVALIENMHRRDLNVFEEAAAYKQLIEQFDYTQDKLAHILSRSRSHVANLLRLLTLPKQVQEQVSSNLLSTGHARTLVGLKNCETVAQHIIDQDLNVRQAEILSQSIRENPNIDFAKLSLSIEDKKTKTTQKKAATNKHHLQVIEEQLSNKVGLKIRIKTDNKQGGVITVTYETLEEFDRISTALKQMD